MGGEAIRQLAEMIAGGNRRSSPRLSKGKAVKILRMELTLRLDQSKIKIPMWKEETVFELLPDDQAPAETTIHQAQQMAGERLWLSQRPRPDLCYGFDVVFCPQASAEATLYPDTAFAPTSRSQTGWDICYAGTPVLWRSSRRSTPALSTAAVELIINAILEGSIAMLGWSPCCTTHRRGSGIEWLDRIP